MTLPTRFKYFREGRRIITIAYIFDKDTGKVEYGACIYKKLGKDSWNKKGHRTTATRRLNEWPVTIHVNKATPYREIEGKIRCNLFRFGVQGCKGNNKGTEIDVQGDSMKELYENLKESGLDLRMVGRWEFNKDDECWEATVMQRPKT